MEERHNIFDKADTHLDGIDDPTLLILKGHLLIEDAFHRLLDACAAQPRHLKNARLSFAQLLCLVRAFYSSEGTEEKRYEEQYWASVASLNAIRNRLAHRLDEGDISQLLRDFLVLTPHAEELAICDPKISEAINYNLGFLFGYTSSLSRKENSSEGKSQ